MANEVEKFIFCAFYSYYNRYFGFIVVQPNSVIATKFEIIQKSFELKSSGCWMQLSASMIKNRPITVLNRKPLFFVRLTYKYSLDATNSLYFRLPNLLMNMDMMVGSKMYWVPRGNKERSILQILQNKGFYF